MTWGLEFSPLLPWSLLAIIAVVALAFVVVTFVRRSRGCWLRLVSLAALLAALANPSLRQEERQTLSNIALVVVDRSASQTLADRQRQTAAILQGLEARLKAIPGLEHRVIDAGRSGGDGPGGTELFDEIGKALSNIPAERLAGVFVITDGQVHDVPKSAGALGFAAPLHALLTGTPDELDRRIEVIKAPRYGLVGSEAIAEVKVRGNGGGAANEPAKLRIRREGQPDIEMTVDVDQPVEVPVGFPHAGPNIVEVDLAPIAGEITEANNRVLLTAEGVRENLRVLLVSGEPHAGERTWRNLLKSDAAVDLVHFTILRPPQKQDGTPINELSLIAFPTRELFQEKLQEFDLIIFDRYQRQSILPALYIDNIARFVEEQGGAVLVAAGDDYASPTSLWNTPLAQVLPAEPTGRVIDKPFKPTITDAGRRHPVTSGLPGGNGDTPTWGRWFRVVETAPPTGTVVMNGADDRPLLVLARKGKGRVALLLSDHAWLWARGLEGGGPHTDLLRRLGHWLMKEPDLEEEHIAAKAKGRKIEIERRSMSDSAPLVTLFTADGKSRDVVLEPAGPGRWTASVEINEPGLVRLKSGDLETVASAGVQNSREFADVTATDALLKPLLQANGGGAFWPAVDGGLASDGVPRLSLLSGAKLMHGAGWAGLLDRDAFLSKGVRLIPLMTGVAALALLLGLISLAWWREGR